MSKTVKRKFTVELPKPRDLSINRLSVFQRLGTKKLKAAESIASSDSQKSQIATNNITTPTPSTSAALSPSIVPAPIILPPTVPQPLISSAFATAAALAAKIIDTKQQQQQQQQLQQQQQQLQQQYHQHHTPPQSIQKPLSSSTAFTIKAAAIHDPAVVTLDDADPDILERKRAELQKELELQLKMETSAASRSAKMIGSSSAKDHHQLAATMRKRKKLPSSSSSSSSSSDSSSSDSSTSSSSKDHGASRRKVKKSSAGKAMMTKRGRGGGRSSSSPSSDTPHRMKKTKTKRVCHKKLAGDPNKLHKSGHSKKMLVASSSHQKLRKRSQSPSMTRKRMTAVVASPNRLSHKMKSGKISATGEIIISSSKHQHRMKEMQMMRDKDRDGGGAQHIQQQQQQQHHHQRERERMRSRERGRSRTPKFRAKSRSPKRLSPRSREMMPMHKSSPSPMSRGARLTPTKPRAGMSGLVRRDRTPPPERSISSSSKKDMKRYANSRERERDRLRDKERREREHEAAREKERQEILARCQERQRERERLAREKLRRDREDDRGGKSERLLPRPAERAMALAAAHDRSRDKSMERADRAPRSHSQLIRDRLDRDKDNLSVGYGGGGGGVGGGYERDDVRYHEHDRMDRRLEKEDDRDYMMVRRHEDSPYMNRVLDKRMDREMIDRDMYGGPGVDQRYDDHLRDDRRDPHDYGGVPGINRGGAGNVVDRNSSGYIDDRHRVDRERDWIREPDINHREPVDRNLIYDHPVDRHGAVVGSGGVRDWDRADVGVPPVRDNYADTRDWGGNVAPDHGHIQWDAAPPNNAGNVGGNWPQEEEGENWDHHTDDKEWQDYHRGGGGGVEKIRHDNIGGANIGGIGQHPNTVIGVGNIGGGGGVVNIGGNQNRRWNNWRGRRGNQHHGGNDFRRHNNMHQQQDHQQQQQPIQQPYPSRAELTFNRRHQLQNKNVEPLLSLPTIPQVVIPPVVPVNEFRPIVLSPQPLMNLLAKPELQPIAVTQPQLIKVVPVVPMPTDAIEIDSKDIANLVAPIEKDGVPMTTSVDEILDEDNLSEISDEADEILNLPEELQEKSADTAESTDAEQPAISCQPSDLLQLPETDNASNQNASQISLQQSAAISTIDFIQSNDIITERPQPVHAKPMIETSAHETTITKDITDDMDLDFEEISDGELEEEARIRGLGDALGVDWASLVEESRAIAREKSNVRNTSAKQRWKPHRILLDVGISLKMAGTKFGTDMLRNVYAKLEEEEIIEKITNNDDGDTKLDKKKIKLEDDSEINEMSVEVKKEISTEDEDGDCDVKEEEQKPIDVKSVKTEPSTSIDMNYHPIASVQVAHRANIERRRGLVFNATGPYSRALSTRRDLQMRRQLCGQSMMPIRKCSTNATKSETASQKEISYRNLALELFQKAMGKVR